MSGLDDLQRWLDAVQALGPRPTRIIVHDKETEVELLRDVPRAVADQARGPWGGLPIEIDPEDAPETGLYYVDYRPVSEWANRRG